MFEFFKNMKADAQAGAMKSLVKTFLTEGNITDGINALHKWQDELEAEAGAPLMFTAWREAQTKTYVLGAFMATPEGNKLFRKFQIGTHADVAPFLTALLTAEKDTPENGKPDFYRPAGHLPGTPAPHPTPAAGPEPNTTYTGSDYPDYNPPRAADTPADPGAF